jgi:hypothetical protein
MYKAMAPFLMGMSMPAFYFALRAESAEKALSWIGYGVVLALLSIAAAVAARGEK